MLLIGAILAGYVYFVSLYLQKVLGFSPVATGLALVPSTVTVVFTSTLGTRRLLALRAHHLPECAPPSTCSTSPVTCRASVR